MLPVEADWAKVGIKGREGMTREADEWTTRMEGVVLALAREAEPIRFPLYPIRSKPPKPPGKQCCR